VGLQPPRPAEQRSTRLEPTSTDAIATATTQNGAFAPPSATARAWRRVPRTTTRGFWPRTLGSNAADLGLALFTASTALHCARLDLLGGDLAAAEEELRRTYDAVASSEEACLVPPVAELLAEAVGACGQESGEIARAAEVLPASDAGEPQARWPAVGRSALDWREQADAAEWRARDALDLVRIGAAFARLRNWHARSARGDGERRASARRAWPARRDLPGPGLARGGLLREILANENLPDGYARQLALELLDVPEELWGRKTTIDPGERHLRSRSAGNPHAWLDPPQPRQPPELGGN
jgi:hypothetical protein